MGGPYSYDETSVSTHRSAHVGGLAVASQGFAPYIALGPDQSVSGTIVEVLLER